MKFKVGDRVRVARKHTSFNCDGKMNCWIGKVMTVSSTWGSAAYRMEEDKGKWAWFEDCLEPVNDTIIIYRNENTVTALNKSTNEKGIAKCSPSDKFDLYTGSRLALDRLFGKEVKADKSQVREVKRPAKVGEWVKIVKTMLSENCYESGDICKCLKRGKNGGCYITSKATHPCNIGEHTSYAYDSEYVVLENYTPSEPVAEPVKETFYNGKVVCVDKNGNHGLYTTGKIYEFIDGQMVCNNRSKFPSIKIHSFDEWQVLSSAKWLEIKE